MATQTDDSALTVYKKLAQGTEEWYEARRGIVTASEVHKLLTAKGQIANNDTSRGYIADLAIERITGRVEPMHQTWDMLRGDTEEVYAREAYEEHYAPVEQIGFMVRDIGGARLGYSPDGLVFDDGAIEIKSRKARIQVNTIMQGQPPRSVDPQLQAGLLVSKRNWIDYVSYSNGMPFWTHRVYPDHEYQKTIIEAVKHAEQEICALIAQYEALVQGLPVMEWRDYDEEMEIF